MTCCKNMSPKAALLQKINEVSFAVNDIQLFLDTHPCDEKALAFYQNAAKQRNELLREYAESYGPLTVDTAVFCNADTWKWMEQPFPWEREGGCR